MPAQTKNRAALIQAAAVEMRLIDASGDTLAPEDAVIIDGYIDAFLADLDSRAIISIPDAESIPIQFFNAVAKLLCYECQGAFGKPPDPQQGDFYEERLRVAVNNEVATNRYLRVDRALIKRAPWSLLNFRRGF